MKIIRTRNFQPADNAIPTTTGKVDKEVNVIYLAEAVFYMQITRPDFFRCMYKMWPKSC